MNPVFQTALLTYPSQGNMILPMRLDLTGASSLDVDLSEEIQTGKFDFVQTIFVDNSQNTAQTVIVFNDAMTGGYRLVVQPYRQGWFPTPTPKGECRFTVQTNGALIVPIKLANHAVPYFEYGPEDGALVVPALTNAAYSGALAMGDNVLVAGVLAQAIRLYRGIFSVDAPTVLSFTDGPGGALLFAAQLTAGGSVTFQGSGVPWFAASTGNDLILNSSAAVNMYGGFGYVQS